MWIYQGSELIDVPPDIVGFVYCITNLSNGKRYIGKKNFYSLRRVKVRNKPNRKRVKAVSDWREYFGSNVQLVADVEALGPLSFKREIIHLCRSKAEMSYLEIKEQIERRVLFDESYYNNFIGCRIHANHLKNMA